MLRAGRGRALPLLFLMLAVLALGDFDSAPLATLHNAQFDRYQRMMPRDRDAEPVLLRLGRDGCDQQAARRHEPARARGSGRALRPDGRIPESERPVVSIGPFEHHSNELPWRESIADVVVIHEDADGHVDLEHLEQELVRYAARPLKIGSFSAASNVTGIASDTAAISTLLHRHGALSFWDYAAAGPYVEIRMREPKIEQDGSRPAGVDDALAYKDAVFISPHSSSADRRRPACSSSSVHCSSTRYRPAPVASASPTAEVATIPKAAGKAPATPTAEVRSIPKAAGKASATPTAEVARMPKAAGKPKTARSQNKRKQKK